MRGNRIWLKIWNAKPPRTGLFIINVIVAFIMTSPILYIIKRAASAPVEKWGILFATRIPEILWDTLSLAGAVAAFTTLIGVSLAWLVECTDLPGRKYLKLALTLPLAIPPYIGALTYIIIFGKRGVLFSLLGSSVIDIYSFWSVTFVMSMFTFPYVFLIVSAALRKISANYEEAGRSCGASYASIFRHITLPLVMPAVISGNIIVFFYIISDFGAVAMLRYTTFTSSVYFQMVGKLDRSGAAILSILTIGLGLIVLLIKNQVEKNRGFFINPKSNRIPKPIKLKKYKIPCMIFTAVVMFFSIILPLSTLIQWSIKGILAGAVIVKMASYIMNSLYVSIGAAAITMLFSVPVAYFKFRHPSKITNLMNNMCHLGLIVPGTLLALGMVFVLNRYFNWLVGSQLILVFGLALRYFSRSLQSVEASMSLISPIIDETAYSLGKRFGSVLLRVILPSILPGVLSGGALVLVSSMKELPVTLMLRPAGFDTLAVRIWVQASDGFYTQAAPSGLLIVIISLIPLYFLTKKEKGG